MPATRETEMLLAASHGLFPRPDGPDGKPISLTTLHRWRLVGINGVRLECFKVGGRWFTSVEAVQRFRDAVSAAESGVVGAVEN